MVRLILFAVAVYALVWLLRRALEGPRRAEQRGRAAGSQKPGTAELVRCAQCGLHLPKSEAREVSGHFYCSEEHARLGAKWN